MKSEAHNSSQMKMDKPKLVKYASKASTAVNLNYLIS